MKLGWIKVILPNGQEKWVRKIEFGRGFEVVDSKHGVTVNNLSYLGGLPFEYAKNIFDISKYEWSSLAPNDKWNNAYTFVVQNNTDQEEVTFSLTFDTTTPIGNELMRLDLGDVIVVDEFGEVKDWYFDATSTVGEVSIVVKDRVPTNGGAKKYFVLFGNTNCIGVFRKPAGASVVKLPIPLDQNFSYSIYPLSDQTKLLNWASDGTFGYVDVSQLNDGDLFVVELDPNGVRADDTVDTTIAVDVEKVQKLSPLPELTPNVNVRLLRTTISEDFPYYWRFDVVNESTEAIDNDVVVIEFDTTDVVGKGLMKPDASDLRVYVVAQDNKPVQKLDFWIEDVGTASTKLYTRLSIAPGDRVRLMFEFGNPYAYPEYSGEKVFDFFERFGLKEAKPLITVNPMPIGGWKVSVTNQYNAPIKAPIKLPIKASSVFDGYLVVNGVSVFDNDGGGVWTNYIHIPVLTPPTEDVQYMIYINGDAITVKSNDLTTDLVTGSGGSIFWNHVKNDGSDIRAFDISNFSQNYFWIEEFDYTNKIAKIWVRLKAGQESLDIAFGNQCALDSNFNNGESTFEFFDDFDGTDVDTTKWQLGDSTWAAPQYEVSNSILHIWSNGTWATMYSTVNYSGSSTAILEALVSIGGVDEAPHILYFTDNGTGNLQRFGWQEDGPDSSGNNIRPQYYVDGTLYTTAPFFNAANDWYLYQIIKTGGSFTGNVFDVSGTKTAKYSMTSSPWSSTTWVIRFWIKLSSGSYYDWVRVRKYLSSNIQFGTPSVKQY